MNKKERIRQLLVDGQPHAVEELVLITHRFSAVIDSLRKDDGHKNSQGEAHE